MDEIRRTIKINPHFEVYEGFFDHKWREEFLALIRSSKLRECGFDLVRGWEGVSNARQISWLMVQCLDVALGNSLRELEPPDRKTIRRLRENLVKRLQEKGEKARPAFWRKLQQTIEEIDREATEIIDNLREQVSSQTHNLWESFLEEETFHTSLWSSERMCYGALYYGYECFLRECVRIKRREEDYQIRRADDFKKDFRNAFGQELANACWSDQKVNIARLARHALAHNGGRITSVLEKQPHNFPVQDGEIQIGAPHTTELYELLKNKVYQMAESAVKMREFS